MRKNGSENEKNSSHFLLGAVIGAAATALLTTKTGRKILTELSENGAELLDEKIDIKNSLENSIHQEEPNLVSTPAAPKSQQEETRNKPKRLFKGIK